MAKLAAPIKGYEQKDGEDWADLPNRDLGYPCTLQRRDGTLCTVHYGQDGEGVTAIWATDWHLDD